MDLNCLAPALERLVIDEAPSRRSHRLEPPLRHPNSTSNPALKKDIAKQERLRKRHRRRLERQLHLLYRQHPEISTPISVCDNDDSQWSRNPAPDPTPAATGWGDPPPPPTDAAHTAPPRALSEEELARMAAIKAQQNGLRLCRDFFSNNEVMDEDEDEEETGAFDFFRGVFEKDDELRGFYEKNWKKGDFFCLVCEGIGEKVGKWFVNCPALVQHSHTISKTKRIEAHRAFGRAVCLLLGWDASCPSNVIVHDHDEPVGWCSASADNLQEEAQKGDNIIENGSQEDIAKLIPVNNSNLMDYVQTN